jgi:hypothetical protein
VRADTIAFERAAVVRNAALRWKTAGLLDERTESLIRDEYPDPRRLPSWVWRVLTFVLVTVIVLGIFLAVAVSGVRGERGLAFLCLFVGGACVVATELQERSPPLAQRGGAGATAFWAGVLVTVGGAILVDKLPGSHWGALEDAALFISFLFWAAAFWRWRSPVHVAFSAASFFFLMARLPSGRLIWIVAGAALATLAWRHLDDARWSPSRRTAAAVLLVAGLAAVYGAANYWSVETGWIEKLRASHTWRDSPSVASLVASEVATALMPVALLAWGIRPRRTLLIDLGIVLAALSLVTLRHYVQIAALWAVLASAGAILLAVALALSRWLSRGPGKERGGFTAEPLFSDEARARLLQVVPVAATLTPTAPPAGEKGFTPGGGSFGGGGASERF